MTVPLGTHIARCTFVSTMIASVSKSTKSCGILVVISFTLTVCVPLFAL